MESSTLKEFEQLKGCNWEQIFLDDGSQNWEQLWSLDRRKKIERKGKKCLI